MIELISRDHIYELRISKHHLWLIRNLLEEKVEEDKYNNKYSKLTNLPEHTKLYIRLEEILRREV